MRDIHGGDIWEASRRASASPGDLLDFSSSVNPLGLPKKAAIALKRALRYASPYPDPSSFLLKSAIAEFHNVSPEEILPGNGSTELIYLMPGVLKPENALIIEPAFSEYRRSLELCACPVDSLVLKEEEGFRFDMERFRRRVKRGYGAVYIANPSNPAGALMEKDALIEAAFVCRDSGAWLVVDEAFMDFCEHASVKSHAVKFKNLIVLRSMTKFFSMAGLRLGFIIAHRDTVKRFQRYMPPWSVNTLASCAAIGALKDRAYMEKTHRWLGAERDFLSVSLCRLGLKVSPSSANFLIFKTSPPQPAARQLSEELFRRGILIRDLSAFKGLGPRHLRVAVRTRQENRKLIGALRLALKAGRGKGKGPRLIPGRPAKGTS